MDKINEESEDSVGTLKVFFMFLNTFLLFQKNDMRRRVIRADSCSCFLKDMLCHRLAQLISNVTS